MGGASETSEQPELTAHTPCYLTVRGKWPFISEQKVRVWVAGQTAAQPARQPPGCAGWGPNPLTGTPSVPGPPNVYRQARNQIPTNNKGTLKNNLSIHKRKQRQLHPSLPWAAAKCQIRRKSFQLSPSPNSKPAGGQEGYWMTSAFQFAPFPEFS